MELLQLNKSYTIKTLSCDTRVSERLKELGFIPGRLFKVLSQAPFNGPFVIEIHGTLVALRHAEVSSMSFIKVEG